MDDPFNLYKAEKANLEKLMQVELEPTKEDNI